MGVTAHCCRVSLAVQEGRNAKKMGLCLSPRRGVCKAASERFLSSTTLLDSALKWFNGFVLASERRWQRRNGCGSADTKTGRPRAAHSFSKYVGTGPREYQA